MYGKRTIIMQAKKPQKVRQRLVMSLLKKRYQLMSNTRIFMADAYFAELTRHIAMGRFKTVNHSEL